MENGTARRGEIWRLSVAPPAWYAGSVGAKALVEDVSPTAIYVVYETGLRESFPHGRFRTFFEPAHLAASQRPLAIGERSVQYAGRHGDARAATG